MIAMMARSERLASQCETMEMQHKAGGRAPFGSSLLRRRVDQQRPGRVGGVSIGLRAEHCPLDHRRRLTDHRDRPGALRGAETGQR